MKRMGRCREKSRFNYEESEPARAHALGDLAELTEAGNALADVGGDVAEGAGPGMEDLHAASKDAVDKVIGLPLGAPLRAASGFDEVGREVMARGWRVVMRLPFSRAEPIHVKEARAPEWFARAACKSADVHETRVVLLGDNLGVVLSLVQI